MVGIRPFLMTAYTIVLPDTGRPDENNRSTSINFLIDICTPISQGAIRVYKHHFMGISITLVPF